jgi:rubrerythrin
MPTIEQAIRNAIEVERAAARFYTGLVPKATDDRTRQFLEQMAAEEQHHAEEIARMGARLGTQELPERPDHNIATVETSPGWDEAESIDLLQALSLALDAENHAALYYDAVADSCGGELQAFLRELSEQELQHARRLGEWLERLEGGATA